MRQAGGRASLRRHFSSPRYPEASPQAAEPSGAAASRPRHALSSPTEQPQAARGAARGAAREGSAFWWGPRHGVREEEGGHGPRRDLPSSAGSVAPRDLPALAFWNCFIERIVLKRKAAGCSGQEDEQRPRGVAGSTRRAACAELGLRPASAQEPAVLWEVLRVQQHLRLLRCRRQLPASSQLIVS